DVLLQRVQRLPEEARRLLEVVAVSGRPLPLALACQAAAVGDEERAALAVLRAGRLLRVLGSGQHEKVETCHDRVRETGAGSRSAQTLRAHHARLAQAWAGSGEADLEVLAGHWHDAGELARAGAYYAEAAALANGALAFDRAARLYRLALQLQPLGPADKRHLQRQLADALVNAGRGALAAPLYLEAAAGAAAAEAIDLRRRAAEQLLCSGHIEQGRAVLRTVLSSTGMGIGPTAPRAV